MSHAKNKVTWCLKKAEKELQEQGKHRGLVKTKPDRAKADQHIVKAEHYLRATEYLKKGNFSDISTSTAFYCMYHSLLAIAAKFGYESANQECTFALMYSLIEDQEIDLNKDLLEKVALLDVEKTQESSDNTTVAIREEYQYGTSLEIDNNLYKQLLELAQKILSQTKEIIER